MLAAACKVAVGPVTVMVRGAEVTLPHPFVAVTVTVIVPEALALNWMAAFVDDVIEPAPVTVHV
jgi:hypothetical protein